ncbi:Gfo/Idh/MocA family protein [Botrimarina mediterranea]|uniref:Putative oxidoreductase YvaA n=1 Tax=Botrimarina mediterranea TaxID=2528022 RepID=A0A518KAU9_9BACT|nr:Gfo/Idh/MocA family oxidoreductase [Botrimarina mediterranea]QDV74914.1 putative oxidoreductase YvaA [Botrimarina mediterranea]QDV79559.1 putative oxidoreductase YvaA [Planctomycetes bacterium K2D]
MNLSDEEKAIGQDNFRRVSGELLARNESRRDFLKEVTLAGAVAAGGFGAAYWGYGRKLDDRLRVGVIGTGDEGNVLIGALNPDFIDVKAIADIRPYNQHRAFYGDWSSDGTLDARPGLCRVYGYKDRTEAEKSIAVYNDYNELLERDDIEAVIIALPLWMHHPAAVAAMRAGKHVLTEKLMAWDVAQCKEMARVADETGLLLATGHQRHYSVLYDNAVDTIRRGLIGDIHSIRAQWHRGNLPGNDSWTPPVPQGMDVEEVKNLIRAARKLPNKQEAEALEAQIKATHELVLSLESWELVLAGKHPKYGKLSVSDQEKWAMKVAQLKAQLEDINVDAKDYGYEEGTLSGGYHRSALEELIRWRIWNRTGGGLMAELGSHQLDASGIFISSQFEGHVKVNPLSVTAVGGRYIFPQDRDCDDHVYATYEYPGKGYFEDNNPSTAKVADANKKVGVVYSSINGNGFGGYGEVVLGTDGTLILEREQDVLLYGGSNTRTKVTVNDAADALDSYETGGGYTPAAQAVTQAVSRGYKEEIEHWAWCIRNGEPATTLHCHPKVALADAVIALTTNIAIAENRRIDFNPEWFDPASDAVPGGRTPRKASDVKV